MENIVILIVITFIMTAICIGFLIGIMIGIGLYYTDIMNRLQKIYDCYCDIEYSISHSTK